MGGQQCGRDSVHTTVLPGGWLPDGEAPGGGPHFTFSVLVGAQPVPSIECSLSKLKQMEKRSGE